MKRPSWIFHGGRFCVSKLFFRLIRKTCFGMFYIAEEVNAHYRKPHKDRQRAVREEKRVSLNAGNLKGPEAFCKQQRRNDKSKRI